MGTVGSLRLDSVYRRFTTGYLYLKISNTHHVRVRDEIYKFTQDAAPEWLNPNEEVEVIQESTPSKE